MTELYKLKTAYEESQDQIETIRKENKTLTGTAPSNCCRYRYDGACWENCERADVSPKKRQAAQNNLITNV